MHRKIFFLIIKTFFGGESFKLATSRCIYHPQEGGWGGVEIPLALFIKKGNKRECLSEGKRTFLPLKFLFFKSTQNLKKNYRSMHNTDQKMYTRIIHYV